MKTITATFHAGTIGKNLPETIEVKSKTLIGGARAMSKKVGKLGYCGTYLAQHVNFGWGNWFCVNNAGVNATYKLTEE